MSGLWAGGLRREGDPGARRGLEKRDLRIGSTAEERGRWMLHSSGSRLEGKGGLQRSRRANLGRVRGMLISDGQVKGRAALQVAMVSGGRFPRCCSSGCRGCSQGCSCAAGMLVCRGDAHVPHGPPGCLTAPPPCCRSTTTGPTPRQPLCAKSLRPSSRRCLIPKLMCTLTRFFFSA